MAFAPVLAAHWWEKHYPKIALGLGAITTGIYAFVLHDTASLAHAAQEYFSFIALVGSLYIVSGGIQIQAGGRSTPFTNVLFLLTGAVLANILGTTGAAMLLIRPWLRLNRSRIAAHHIAFFIFIVANVGGCLTPIGDPPLFLGFLEGIPFWWIGQHAWPAWLTGVGLLLFIFYLVDRMHLSRSPVAGAPAPETWKFSGRMNLTFLAVILVAVFIHQPPFLREILMLAAAAGSYFTTAKAIHRANEFNFHPAAEVAILFAGIFSTMIPALAWLDHHAGSLLGQNPGPTIFYWGTGALSAVLDNAPTYLAFLSALRGVMGDANVLQFANLILAISIGAVFFGAATYIGNGPNFMVKAIAQQSGVRMPSFMEFVFRFTLPYLVPVLMIVWWLFFRS